MNELQKLVTSGLAVAISAAWLAVTAAQAATKTVDLDGLTANGAESQCDTNLVNPALPTAFRNTVTNRSGGNAFNFSWPSAGPGGFTANVRAGTPGGVGATWEWTTYESVVGFTGNTCASDICLSKTSGPDPLPGTCSLACPDGVTVRIEKRAGSSDLALSWLGGAGPYTVYRATSPTTIASAASTLTTTGESALNDVPPPGTSVYYQVRGTGCAANSTCTSNAQCGLATEGFCANRGPFGVPGRSLVSSGVTVSSGSLTSSLITFFSPPQEIFRAKSIATAGGVLEERTNLSEEDVIVTTHPGPPGCCPASEGGPQLNCQGVCVHYLWDPDNCGGCGNVCDDGDYCDDGYCTSSCDCDPYYECCVDGGCTSIWSDPYNCGECGNVCDEGEYCDEGYCTPSCYCDYETQCCIDGECVTACPPGYSVSYVTGECVDTQNDSNNCGEPGNVCPAGACCFHYECVSLTCEDVGGLQPDALVACDGYCYDTDYDDSHCGDCGANCNPYGGTDFCCNGALNKGEPSCGPACDGGRTRCGDDCVDTSADPLHCNGCGQACGVGECCAGEVGCRPVCPVEGEESCEVGWRTNTDSDPNNCGACGNTCAYFETCCGGECYSECDGEPTSPHPDGCTSQVPPVPVHCAVQMEPFEATCPNPTPSFPVPSQCEDVGGLRANRGRPVPSAPRPTILGECLPDAAPICQTGETTVTIPAGGTTTTCTPGGPLFREVPAAIDVCGDAIPGVNGACNNTTTKVTTGTFNRFVADTETPLGDAFVTPFAVHIVSETSGDGLLEPGESADLIIAVLNAGPMDITDASGRLAAPEIDLADDGVYNPVGIVVADGAMAFGTIPGTPAATDCEAPPLQTASNSTVFQITVPEDHPGDTSHPFTLTVTGTVAGRAAASGPFTMEVPLNIGIADRCDPSEHTRDYDGLEGMLGPNLARLVPAGEPVPFPANDVRAGTRLSLRLHVACGGTKLGDGEVDAPEIVALSEAVRGPIDVSTLFEEKQQALSTSFVWDDDRIREPDDDIDDYDDSWKYKLRTSDLGAGRYTITIRIAGRKDYVTGFQLQ